MFLYVPSGNLYRVCHRPPSLEGGVIEYGWSFFTFVRLLDIISLSTLSIEIIPSDRLHSINEVCRLELSFQGS